MESGKVKKIRGYASVFGEIDKARDRICRGAFAKAIGAKIPMFYRHFKGLKIGEWQTIQEDRRGLYVEGEIYLERCAKLGILAQLEGPLGLSVGMKLIDSKSNRGVRDIYEAQLTEISILPEGQQVCRSALVF